jgi:hypothetical protein
LRKIAADQNRFLGNEALRDALAKHAPPANGA